MTTPPSGASGSEPLFPSMPGGNDIPPELLQSLGKQPLLPLNDAFCQFFKKANSNMSDQEAQQAGTLMANQMVKMMGTQIQNETQKAREDMKEDWQDLTSS